MICLLRVNFYAGYTVNVHFILVSMSVFDISVFLLLLFHLLGHGEEVQ